VRIIFSRKGIDSSTNPCAGASPVFSDGSFLSIPIPYPHSPVRYCDISAAPNGHSVAEIVESLTGAHRETYAHLDPDLCSTSRATRASGWRPAYGQAGSALSHLRNEGVAEGDLFLFYGRFMPVLGPPWRYRRHPDYKNGDFQAVWGWLRVGTCVDLDVEPAPAGNADHPHAHGHFVGGNTLYLSAARLGLRTLENVPGGGILPRLRPLTAKGENASSWLIDKRVLTKQRQEHVGNCDQAPDLLASVLELLSEAS
jgi:hypothetical protein